MKVISPAGKFVAGEVPNCPEIVEIPFVATNTFLKA
jgi:hypothetical protein